MLFLFLHKVITIIHVFQHLIKNVEYFYHRDIDNTYKFDKLRAAAL